MKDYLLEQWVWIKTHKFMYGLLIAPYFPITYWLLATMPAPGYLSVGPVLVAIGYLVFAIIVADISISRMRKNMTTMVLIMSILLFPGSSQAQLIATAPSDYQPFEPRLVQGEMEGVAVGIGVGCALVAGNSGCRCRICHTILQETL